MRGRCPAILPRQKKLLQLICCSTRYSQVVKYTAVSARHLGFIIFCSFLLPSRLLRYLYFRLRVFKDCGWTCSTWTIVVDLLPESVAAVHRQTALANLHKKYTLQSVVCLIYSSLSLSFDVGLCENHFQLVLAISFSFFRFRSLIFCQQLSFKRR